MTGQWLGRFEFASPLLLLAVPASVALLWLARGRGRRLVAFSSASLVDAVPRTIRVRLAWLPAGLLVLGVCAAGVALARPRLGDERTVERKEGIAIELAVDRSSSMLAHDFTGATGRAVSRLEAVKSVVRDFVAGGEGLPGRPDDSIGLTVFAGYGEAVVPLTLDHGLLLDSLDAVEVADTRLEDGTSIGTGLATSVMRLAEAEQTPSRVVILLTDGRNNDPDNDPLEAARAARELGVRVYTIGMGTTGFAPFPEVDVAGNVHWRRVAVEIDEALLVRIAEETGGTYARAGSMESLREIYREIDRLERTEIEGLVYRRYRELYAWPLGVAAAAWALYLLFDRGPFRRLG